MEYRYFAQPHKFSTYTEVPRRCGICSEASAGYGGPFRGEDDVDFVCEECLHDGGLAELDLAANTPDMESLREQLQKQQPDAPSEHVAQIVEHRYSELAERTPPACIWSFFLWPAHCGDFCRLEKEIGQADILELADEQPPESWLAQHMVRSESDVTAADVWKCLRPDSPEDNAKTYDMTALLFRCLTCGVPVVIAARNPAAD